MLASLHPRQDPRDAERAAATPSRVPLMYSRPAAPIIETSTSVLSGATFSASLAATAANRAGVIS